MKFLQYKINSVVILIFCLIISLLIYKTSTDNERLNLSKYFDTTATLHLNAVQARIESVKDLLTDLKAFYGASNYVDRKEFNDFLSLISDYTGTIQFAGWLPKVTHENYKKLYDEAKEDGIKNFKWGNKTLKNVPFYPLYYGYPRSPDREKLYGKVLSDVPAINELMQKYVNSDQLFIKENDSIDGLGHSFYVFTSIFKEGVVNAENHLGFVFVLFSLEQIVEGLIDTSDQIKEHTLSFSLKQNDQLIPIFTDASEILPVQDKSIQKSLEIDWNNQKWILTIKSTESFHIKHENWQSFALLIIGMLLSIGIARFVFISGRRAEEVDLGNKRLQKEIEDHKSARKKADVLTENLSSLAARHKLFAEALKGTINGLVIIDVNQLGSPIIYVNSAFEKITGYPALEVMNKSWDVFLGQSYDKSMHETIEGQIKKGEDLRIEIYCTKKDQKKFDCELTLYPVFDDATRKVKNYVIVLDDITVRKKIEEERIDFERKASQTSKLESLGTLAAGIAHEINTPVQYVNDNVNFLSKSAESIMALLQNIKSKIHDQEASTEIAKLLETADYEFLKTELPESIHAAKDGITRVEQIVRAVKDFSKPPSSKMSREDINRAIESSLVVSSHHWKNICKIIKDFDKNLPHIPCHLGEINQVFLNLIVNAVDACSLNDKTNPPELRISTKQEDKNIVITFEDNGPGVPEEISMKIFEPFFTTKEGTGTGQGLAISKMIIEKNHKGKLELASGSHKTQFIITLPSV